MTRSVLNDDLRGLRDGCHILAAASCRERRSERAPSRMRASNWSVVIFRAQSSLRKRCDARPTKVRTRLRLGMEKAFESGIL